MTAWTRNAGQTNHIQWQDAPGIPPKVTTFNSRQDGPGILTNATIANSWQDGPGILTKDTIFNPC